MVAVKVTPHGLAGALGSLGSPATISSSSFASAGSLAYPGSFGQAAQRSAAADRQPDPGPEPRSPIKCGGLPAGAGRGQEVWSSWSKASRKPSALAELVSIVVVDHQRLRRVKMNYASYDRETYGEIVSGPMVRENTPGLPPQPLKNPRIVANGNEIVKQGSPMEAEEDIPLNEKSP